MSSILPDPDEPAAEDILWRYLPHANFERLLKSRPSLSTWGILSDTDPCPDSWRSFGSLWFAGPDLYRMKDLTQGGDPREGTFPAFNLVDEEVCRHGAGRMGLDPEGEEAKRRCQAYLRRNNDWFRGQKRLMTRLCGVTCWHHNMSENPDMWRAYVPGGMGVVVRNTMLGLAKSVLDQTLIVHERATNPSEVRAASKFREALQVANLKFARAKYVDLDDTFEPLDGFRDILRLKGEGFRHENELRGIARSPFLADRSNKRLASLSEVEVNDSLKRAPGFNMSVNLETLLAEVRVSPGAGDTYLEKVRGLMATKGLTLDRVRLSELDNGVFGGGV